METILTELENYLKLLNWTYIITFIVITWLFSRDNALESWWKEEKYPKLRSFFMWFPKGLRVALIGFVYGIIHYFAFSHEKGDMGELFISFLFAVTFHGIIIKGLQKKLGL